MPEYPDVISIIHDDYHTEHIGRTGNGRQFILTEPFVPETNNDKGSDFIALYIFDEKGKLIEYTIEKLGPRNEVDEGKANDIYNALLDSLDEVSFCDVEISPFRIEKYGVEFGLLPTDPIFVDDEQYISLEFHPGNYMAFYPPWDGEYDT